MKEKYLDKVFYSKSLVKLDKIDEIVTEYQAQGLTLSVRQAYYQMVARGYILNNQKEYLSIQNLIHDGRLAGLIDWEAFEDRCRAFVSNTRWSSGNQILRAAADSYHVDMWRNQLYRPFVIVEKDALKGVLEPVCRKYDTPLLSSRGYCSASVFHDFGCGDVVKAYREGQVPIIFHWGDHDPAGLGMTEDLKIKLALFSGEAVKIIRLGLNMEDVRRFNPPPNFAKDSDTKTPEYVKRYGSECWELDAMTPTYISETTEKAIKRLIDPECWQSVESQISNMRIKLSGYADGFNEAA